LLFLAAGLGVAALYVAGTAATNGRSFTGVVLSNGVVDLNFATAGQVAQITVRVGQRVAAGQVLATEATTAGMAVAADQAAITADKATLVQLTDQAAPGAAALAEAQAKLANDKARLAAAQMQVEGTQIRAPKGGTVVAVNGQVGETVSAVGIRDDAASPAAAGSQQSAAPPPQGSQSAAAGATLVPVIALRTSANWQVEVTVPVNSTVAVKAGKPVTVTVPAARLNGVRGRIEGLLPTPVRTSQGVEYQALVTVPGLQIAPLSGMAADVQLAS
jgi:multidrug efflux pump subunit AcrA (membrane-fusion protein)